MLSLNQQTDRTSSEGEPLIQWQLFFSFIWEQALVLQFCALNGSSHNLISADVVWIWYRSLAAVNFGSRDKCDVV